MIAEEMEGEGVPKSQAAKSSQAQVEPLEKKGKFEVSLHEQLFPFNAVAHLPPAWLLESSSPPSHWLSATTYPL